MSRRPTQQYSRTSSYQSVEDSEGYDNGDDWRDVEDASERRKIQNRLAQRKFREKAKAAREESVLQSQNQAAAGNAYSQPDPNQLEPDNGHSGLPWGGVSIRHVVERGQLRQQARQSGYNMTSSQPQQSQSQPTYHHHAFDLPSRQRGGATQQSGSGYSRHATADSERSRHDTSSVGNRHATLANNGTGYQHQQQQHQSSPGSDRHRPSGGNRAYSYGWYDTAYAHDIETEASTAHRGMGGLRSVSLW